MPQTPSSGNSKAYKYICAIGTLSTVVGAMLGALRGLTSEIITVWA